MQLLIAMTFVVAVTAAIRSTWSPCGLSMLSSITPIGERGRGNRFRRTATWFVIGATVGGACLGSIGGLLAIVWRAGGADSKVSFAVGVLAAALAVLADLGLLGVRLPLFRRQVNERWLDQFRGPVYGAGFGWQIGFGVATYIMTTGVFLLVLAALSGRFAVAVGVGAVFGLVRGCAVILGRLVTSPEALRRLHRRIDQLAEPARRATVGVCLGVALVLASEWSAPVAITMGAVSVMAGASWGFHRRRVHQRGEVVPQA